MILRKATMPSYLLFVITFIFSICIASYPVNAQTSVLTPLDNNNTKIQPKAEQANESILCLETVSPFVIEVSGGFPNKTITYFVFQSPFNILGLSLSNVGAFSTTLFVSVKLDGSGNGKSDPFFVRAPETGQTILNACSSIFSCTNSITVTVVSVTSVAFEVMDSPLDNNPNPGGGMRIFPEKMFPTDSTNRKIIKIKATLSSRKENVPIFFKAFDVDDPSTDSAPVDSNGSNGDDNKGIPQNGTLKTMSVKTDRDGVAKVEFTVTSQPGDNFKLTAGCDQEYLNGLTVSATDLKDSMGNMLPTNRAKVTPMLTVWRRVHIEVDSMGAVVGNNVTGKILKIEANKADNFTRLVLDKPIKEKRFEGGRITIDSLGTFSVITNSSNDLIVREVIRKKALNKTFILVDDDDFNDNDGSNLDGDEGEDIPSPNLSLIQDSDNPDNNVFAPAYVRPTYDLSGQDTSVPFVLNTPSANESSVIGTYKFDNKGTEADRDFWTVYLLGAYQFTTAQDGDPDGDPVLGVADGLRGVGASVFNEVLRNKETKISPPVSSNAATTAHEIGHLFGGDDGEGGLMNQNTNRVVVTFAPVTLEKIRVTLHP